MDEFLNYIVAELTAVIYRLGKVKRALEYSPHALLLEEEDWVSLRDATMGALTEAQRMFVLCKEAQELKVGRGA
jgi:hypothetical protein